MELKRLWRRSLRRTLHVFQVTFWCFISLLLLSWIGCWLWNVPRDTLPSKSWQHCIHFLVQKYYIRGNKNMNSIFYMTIFWHYNFFLVWVLWILLTQLHSQTLMIPCIMHLHTSYAHTTPLSISGTKWSAVECRLSGKSLTKGFAF